VGSVHDISLSFCSGGEAIGWRVCKVANDFSRLFNPMCRRDEHSTTTPAALHATGQIDRALPPPTGDEGVEGVNVTGDQRARRTAGLDRE
jgi:hypothetical protein